MCIRVRLTFLSSFCLALFTEAKLLSLVSISSLKALDTVNLISLFLVPNLDFLSLSSSFLNLFVALCSASFLFSKSLIPKLELLTLKFVLKLLTFLKLFDDVL